MAEKQDLPVICFASKLEFEQWLESERSSSAGLWLKIAKKNTGLPTVTYAEALDAALCFGWIDGQKGSVDDQYWRQRFTPRTASCASGAATPRPVRIRGSRRALPVVPPRR
jgi:uncharacterized protein YdeI (YjbR/CyaY-like superfamily)